MATGVAERQEGRPLIILLFTGGLPVEHIIIAVFAVALSSGHHNSSYQYHKTGTCPTRQPLQSYLVLQGIASERSRSLGHLHIFVTRPCLWRACRYRRRCLRTLGSLFGGHGVQVDLDDIAFEYAEVALRGDVLLMRATGPNDTEGGVVDRELLVLLEGFTKCV